MRISLIVTTYNRPDALQVVLNSLKNQNCNLHEVIVADDGSDYRTKEVIDNFSKETNENIIHSFQEDLGFRAAKSRNKAIAIATGEYIVLIDGDMILHPEFVNDHLNNARVGYFIQGSRVLLNKNASDQAIIKQKLIFNFFSNGLSNRFNSIHSSFLSRYFLKNKKYLNGIKTCNMSFFKNDCININGFNNEFEGWGREDSEFVVRLMNKGIKRKNLKFQAIQYHLWHDEIKRESLYKNDSLLQQSIDKKLDWCESGINLFI